MAGGRLNGWGFRLAVALDQFLNVLFFLGAPDETISSRAYKASLRGKHWGCILCRLLDVLDRGHCARAVEWDET